jgi:hypothetical protein
MSGSANSVVVVGRSSFSSHTISLTEERLRGARLQLPRFEASPARLALVRTPNLAASSSSYQCKSVLRRAV